MYRKPITLNATIPNGQQESDVIRLGNGIVVALITPAAFTGTAITFLGCDTATGTFGDIYDSDGNQVSVAVAAAKAYGLSGAEADAVSAFPYVKLKSGSAEGAERIVKVLKK